MTNVEPLLALGITGHRWNRLPAAARPSLAADLAALMARIETEALASQRNVTLLSGMAEGADQMAVQAAPERWRIVALLPMPLARYREDFMPDRATGGIDRRSELEAALARADAIEELAFVGPCRTHAYTALGKALLARCHRLIAVWDGKPARGVGGTPWLVGEARGRGMAVDVVSI